MRFFVADLAVLESLLHDPSEEADAFLRLRVESLLAWLNLKAAADNKVAHLPLHRTCEKFVAVIDEEYARRPSIAELCVRIGISQRHLTKLTRQHLGVTPLCYLHDRIALEAIRMLKFSCLSIAQIGYELGFNSPEHFSRFIRREIGAPPARLRKQLRYPT